MSQIIPFSFEDQAVRVQVDAHGCPWFNASDVCDALGFANPRQALDSHVDADDVQKLDATDSLGRTQRANHLNESGLFSLVLGSTKPEARRFKRWVTGEVLPAIRKTGSYVAAAPVQSVSFVGDGCALIESVARTLHLAPSASLGMYHKLADKTGHRDLLPAYAVDSSDSDTGSSEPTASLKTLLLEHETGLSAMKVYPLLEKAGFAQHLSRPSSKGIKKFWCLTEAGHLFGKNLTNPSNSRETQPHFYRQQFPQLLRILGLDGLLEAA
ncbi:BRO-N domain-containing protein [Stenotrophomonas maltophilia]|uniref:BRO-N domain-containing protein n=1 Tax=Stenotrophomonas maltophilia TaxID=40324 RepID=UPI00289617BA|nr:Bro-N domain-containing protein [Stenotrophomonas maltophilia]MDT3472331.1 Bro-N domain-containing protein [Stenotrophomonas maltophilia]